MHSLLRARIMFAALALGTMAVGLIVHWPGTAFPPAARDTFGDALWAMMMFWLIGAIVPDKPPMVRSAFALMICWTVEASQAYHSQFLDNLRQHAVAQLILGSGFDARDLAAYASGVVAALLLELAAHHGRR